MAPPKGTKNNPNGKGGFKDNPKNRNTHGRPKLGLSIADLLREEGDEIIEFNGVKMTKDQALVKQIYALGMGGYLPAITGIMERKEPLKRVIEMLGNIKIDQTKNLSTEELEKKLDDLLKNRKRLKEFTSNEEKK